MTYAGTFRGTQISRTLMILGLMLMVLAALVSSLESPVITDSTRSGDGKVFNLVGNNHDVPQPPYTTCPKPGKGPPPGHGPPQNGGCPPGLTP